MPSKNPYKLDSLNTAIPVVFDQAQSSTVSHKKNCITLYKLHQNAASVTRTRNRDNDTSEKEPKHVGEKMFNNIFMDMMDRVLAIKEGSITADRVIRFVGSYVKFLTQKGAHSRAFRSSWANISHSCRRSS